MFDHYDSAPPTNSGKGMAGFDSEFADIVDYILRITHRIWEGKQVGLCYDYYTDDCPVYSLAGYTEGSEQVVQNTLRTLSAFPDRTLHADNIIWGGDAGSGFHSSHLICTKMTNLGASEFGPATGRKAQIQVIAHCICKENRIVEEWLVRDNMSLARQLGIDPHTWALQQARSGLDPNSSFNHWLTTEHARIRAITTSRVSYAEVGGEDLVKASLQNIWNTRLLGDTNLLYAENAVLHASAREKYTGAGAIARFYLEILGSIPDARVSLDYCCSNSMLDGEYVAVRWTLAGTHAGGALWGEPTGAPLLILGESQFRLEQGKVVEEWLVFDELAVLTQVYRGRIAAGQKLWG